MRSRQELAATLELLDQALQPKNQWLFGAHLQLAVRTIAETLLWVFGHDTPEFNRTLTQTRKRLGQGERESTNAN